MSSHSRLKELLVDDDDDDTILAWPAWKEEKSLQADSSSRRGSNQPRKTIHRDRIGGHNRLIEDYFADDCIYDDKQFRRRYRMRRPLFLRIHDAVVQYDDYFVQKRDAAHRLGLSSLQKITAAIRMLAYGALADLIDEYLKIGASTTLEAVTRFVKAVNAIFSEEYLRRPNINDVARLLSVAEGRGFPGMLGSIDCMHWRWKNCPAAWAGQYTGHHHEPTIILEAVASKDLWIWHAYFELPGSHNDINVLERSAVFADIANGQAAPWTFTVNGNTYNQGYYLADGIYPQWSTLVKTISKPVTLKHKNFVRAQEAAQKDVERAFGVLQARFHIVRGPALFWKRETLSEIMTACIIMHNMIVEDEGPGAAQVDVEENEIPPVPHSNAQIPEFTQFLNNHHQIRNKETHSQLQRDLIEHLWGLYGAQE